jgi:chitodextrinase
MRKLDSRFGGARSRVVLLGLCAAAVLGLAGASTFGASAAPSGLVASYSFDAGTGTTAKDDSGHGNTGTITNASWTNGLHGKALSFNGANSLVTIPDAPALDFTSGMTLEAWVKPSALSGLWRTVVLKEMPGELAYALYAKGDTSAPSGIVNTGSEQFNRTRVTLSLRRWTHLAATYDGKMSRFYLNGQLVAYASASGSILTSNGSLDIGGNNVWNEWFNGVIDDVRVYNRALSASEVSSDMDSAVTVSAAPTTTTTTTTTPPKDTTPPSTPTGLKAAGATTSQITLGWTASTDNTGVAGYGVYLNGAGSGSSGSTSYTFTNLKCGTSYTLGVDAYDAAGNRSTSSSASASTAACPAPTTDTQAPSMPATLSSTASTTTSVSLSWSASTDNVGVASYGIYRDGSGAGSSTATSTTITGLTCGTTYAFAVDAVDAAGNRSTKKTLNVSTSACPVAQGSGSASVFVSPSGSDSSSTCSKTQPCLSFNRAYSVAAPGATVEVAAGSYDGQTLDATPKASGPDVVFQPAAGASVTLADLEVTRGAHVEFRDFTVTTDTYNRPEAQYVTYRRIKMRDFFVRGADHISYIDSDVGPNTGADEMNWITAPYQSTDPASDILLDDVTIHDFTKHMSGSHVDCIGIDDVDGLTIRNSHISRCAHFSIIFGNDTNSGRAARNVLLENNFLDCCDASGGGYYSIGFGGIDGNVMIRYNSADLGFGWLNDTSLVPNGLITIDSNVISNNNSANCSRATWTYNVVASGSACGGTLAATGFTAPPDLHLLGGAAAIGAGNPNNRPSTDIDGQARPSAAPDAGADQR